MAEEKREGPPDKEVQEILSDLDAILSDLGGGQPLCAPAAPPITPKAFPDGRQGQGGVASAPSQPPKMAALPPQSPAPPLQPVVKVPPAPAAPVAPISAAKPPPSAPAVPRGDPIELGARSIPPAKPPEKGPVLSSKPAGPAAFSGKPPMELGLEGGTKTDMARPAASIPARPPQRGLPPADALPDVPTPEKVGKDQIRRVAFLYLGKFEAERDALAKSLDQTAQTVPKKPLFLRRVLYQAIAEDCGGKEILARVLQAKAVAALGIVDGLSETRLRELSEALSGGGVMFRSVAPLDAGKKSVAIDIVVDVMLLPPEAP